jgi:hypothetical protein
MCAEYPVCRKYAWVVGGLLHGGAFVGCLHRTAALGWLVCSAAICLNQHMCEERQHRYYIKMVVVVACALCDAWGAPCQRRCAARCSTSINLAFEGVDKNYQAFQTAAQVRKLNDYSLISMYGVGKSTFFDTVCHLLTYLSTLNVCHMPHNNTVAYHLFCPSSRACLPDGR